MSFVPNRGATLMMPKIRCTLTVLAGVALWALPAWAADPSASLKKGTPDLKSAGPLAFGPDGILFVGDPRGAAIFAIDTDDRPSTPASGGIKVEQIDEKIGALLGTNAKGIKINDLKVNPASGKG